MLFNFDQLTVGDIWPVTKMITTPYDWLLLAAKATDNTLWQLPSTEAQTIVDECRAAFIIWANEHKPATAQDNEDLGNMLKGIDL